MLNWLSVGRSVGRKSQYKRERTAMVRTQRSRPTNWLQIKSCLLIASHSKCASTEHSQRSTLSSRLWLLFNLFFVRLIFCLFGSPLCRYNEWLAQTAYAVRRRRFPNGKNVIFASRYYEIRICKLCELGSSTWFPLVNSACGYIVHVHS